MKKKHIWKTPNTVNSKVAKCLSALKTLESRNNLNLFPINDANKLGVLYTWKEDTQEIAISLFDRTKVTSTNDAIQKGLAKRYDIVGEDCLYYPKFVAELLIPNFNTIHNITSNMTGSMNFDTFADRI